MNRRLLAVTAIVIALGGAIGAGAQSQRQSNRTNWWQAERTFHLTQILACARANYDDALVRGEIGTLAPADIQDAQNAVARMDEMIRADATRKTPLAASAATRTRLAVLLNHLELMEVRFDNGLASTKEMSEAYLAVVQLLVG